MGLSRPLSWTEVDWDSLVQLESKKLQYLLALKRCLNVLNPDFSTFEFGVALESGYRPGRRIDWSSVMRYCAPEIVVVMVTDPDREKNHFDFPGYAIIPRIERVVDLSFAEPSDTTGRSNRDATAESLTYLRATASRLEGDARSRAIKHVDILTRMLKATD